MRSTAQFTEWDTFTGGGKGCANREIGLSRFRHNGNGIGDDEVTIECVDVIVSHIARVCAVLVTRHKLAVSRKYQTA